MAAYLLFGNLSRVRLLIRSVMRSINISSASSLKLIFIGVQFLSFPNLVVAQTAPSEIIFGGDSAYPPFEWVYDGKAMGFNIELEDKIAEIGRAKAIHRLGSWPDTVRALETGDVDIVPMFYSPKRAEKFYFSLPFYHLTHVAYARPDAKDISSFEKLNESKVVVENASFAHDEITRAELAKNLLLVANTLEALKAVASGKADYAVVASASADNLIQRHRLALKRASPPLWPRAYSFAVRKDRESVARWLDESFHLLISDGYYQEVFSRWENELEPRDLSSADVLLKAAYVIVPLGLLTGFGFLWSWSLRRQVATRTIELTAELQRRQAAEREIRFLADHDVDIGFPKLHHFIELLNGFLKDTGRRDGDTAECVVLRLMELPSVIRTFGFSVGDHLLREFSVRLRALNFHVYGYLGQGVFIVLGPKESVLCNWERITSPLETGDLELFPHLVAGVAYWPDHAADGTRLVRAAEIALATGIAGKQHWMVYEPSMEPDPQDLSIVSSFRHGGEKELFAVYQPQVSLESGQVEATESLVRWRHPQLGLIPPGRFIPLLENAGLISRVTHRMIDDAIRMSSLVSTIGLSCRFSVNVSALDLLVPDFPEIVHDTMRRYGGDASCLNLELTETSLADATDRIGIVLEHLRAQGVRIAVDDFGTGYSSLSYLSAFPIDELKIDRNFVSNMLTSARDRSIVRSTISMAHELGLKVVAEGAEDNATIVALKEDGCDVVQGYGISKPLPECELVEFLRRRSLENEVSLLRKRGRD